MSGERELDGDFLEYFDDEEVREDVIDEYLSGERVDGDDAEEDDAEYQD